MAKKNNTAIISLKTMKSHTSDKSNSGLSGGLWQIPLFGNDIRFKKKKSTIDP